MLFLVSLLLLLVDSFPFLSFVEEMTLKCHLSAPRPESSPPLGYTMCSSSQVCPKMSYKAALPVFLPSVESPRAQAREVPLSCPGYPLPVPASPSPHSSATTYGPSTLPDSQPTSKLPSGPSFCAAQIHLAGWLVSLSRASMATHHHSHSS